MNFLERYVKNSVSFNSNGSKESSYLPYKYLQYRNQVESEIRDPQGFVDPWKVEIKLREKLAKEYSKGGIKTYGE